MIAQLTMSEQLSYSDLESKIKELIAEKLLLQQEISNKEQQLNAKDEFYRSVIDGSDAGIIVLQGDTIRFINQSAMQLLEVHDANKDDIKITGFVHPDYTGQLIIWLSEIIEGKLPGTSQELLLKTTKGHVFKSKFRCVKIPFQSGPALLLFSFSKETETKVFTQDSKNHDAGENYFQEHVSEGNFLLSQTDKLDTSFFLYKVEKVNLAGLKILGKETDQVIGQLLGNLMFPDFVFNLPISYSLDYSEEFELYIKNLKKYIRFSIYAIDNEHIACVFSDITDCYLAKGELNRNLQRNELFTEILSIYNADRPYKEKFQLILDRIVYHFKPKRILILTNSGNQKKGELFIQYANKDVEPFPENFCVLYDRVPSWNKLLLDRKMILGFTLQYLPDDLQEYLKGLQMKGAYIFPIIIENHLYGSIVFENIDKIEWDNNEINYLKMVSILIANLTSRQNYEEKLLKSKEKAEEADRLKSSFLANMSYDIRIPMTAIIGFSDLLADPDLTLGEREEFIELISKSGRDLLTLVDNIVDVAKIETGQLRINKEVSSLINIFKELYAEHSKDPKIIEHDDLEIVMDVDAKYQNLTFETDMFRFKQVFSNLIDNAIKFTDRGHVRFGISNIWSDTIEFYVQDSGIGIAEETQHIIFERFSKIDRSYTREYNGTGLGLAICKSMVELMGGEIRVISYPGKGSTFYFTHPLPKLANQNIKREEPSQLLHDPIFTGKTILVAEDVEQNFRFIEFLLEPTKATLVWAKNGKEAVDYAKTDGPLDAILMDIRMPIMNGIDAAKEILRIKKIPILAQTAYTLGDEKEMALNAGCIDYLSKPINIHKLLEILQKILLPNSNL